MGRTWTILFLGVTFVFGAIVPSMAQSRRDNWDSLKELQPGHKVKVVDMDLKAWDGRLVSVSDEAITIREKWKQQEITVERGNVLRVTDLERSKRGRNAVLGLLGGAIVGATRDTEGNAYRAVLAGLFGGIGAGIGALLPGHPTIYRVRHGPQKASAQSHGSRALQ